MHDTLVFFCFSIISTFIILRIYYFCVCWFIFVLVIFNFVFHVSPLSSSLTSTRVFIVNVAAFSLRILVIDSSSFVPSRSIRNSHRINVVYTVVRITQRWRFSSLSPVCVYHMRINVRSSKYTVDYYTYPLTHTRCFSLV